jgi:flagellar basal-body rod protein FlgF
MDRLIYQAMSGAKALMQRQDTLSNNLANVNTTGFRADLVAFRSVPIRAEGSATTRVYNLEASAGFDPGSGTVTQTGRSLDVAVNGSGWIAVQGLDGSEAYTRAGSFEVSAEGVLQTKTGLPVLSDGGPLTVPTGAEVTIGSDGLVSAKAAGQASQQLGTIKLVDPPFAELRKGADGLLRTSSGDPASAEPAVSLSSGVLESSNVNVVEAMVGMIALSRQFEMQMRLLQNAEQNAQRAAQLLSPSG